MSFVAAMLLLYAEPEAAVFRLLCNLLARPCHRAFFAMDADRIARYQTVLQALMHEHVPAVAAHLGRLGVGTDLFLYDWIMTLFAHPLPLDVAARIWDTYLLGGDVRGCLCMD
jgi:hypothetical protein